MSALYGATWPQPWAPSAAVTRTSATSGVENVSIAAIRRSGDNDDLQRLARLGRLQALVDAVERQPVGDQPVELEQSILIQRRQPGHVQLRAGRADLAAEDAQATLGHGLGVDG